MAREVARCTRGCTHVKLLICLLLCNLVQPGASFVGNLDMNTKQVYPLQVVGDIYVKKKVKQLDAPVAPLHPPTWTSCDDCGQREVVEVSELVDLVRAKKMREMGKRLGMKGDRFETVGKYLKIIWNEPRCKISRKITFPQGVWHNCELVEAGRDEVEGDKWWE